jgi:hypothetical protein
MRRMGSQRQASLSGVVVGQLLWFWDVQSVGVSGSLSISTEVSSSHTLSSNGRIRAIGEAADT